MNQKEKEFLARLCLFNQNWKIESCEIEEIGEALHVEKDVIDAVLKMYPKRIKFHSQQLWRELNLTKKIKKEGVKKLKDELVDFIELMLVYNCWFPEPKRYGLEEILVPAFARKIEEDQKTFEEYASSQQSYKYYKGKFVEVRNPIYAAEIIPEEVVEEKKKKLELLANKIYKYYVTWVEEHRRPKDGYYEGIVGCGNFVLKEEKIKATLWQYDSGYGGDWKVKKAFTNWNFEEEFNKEVKRICKELEETNAEDFLNLRKYRPHTPSYRFDGPFITDKKCIAKIEEAFENYGKHIVEKFGNDNPRRVKALAAGFVHFAASDYTGRAYIGYRRPSRKSLSEATNERVVYWSKKINEAIRDLQSSEQPLAPAMGHRNSTSSRRLPVLSSMS